MNNVLVIDNEDETTNPLIDYLKMNKEFSIERADTHQEWVNRFLSDVEKYCVVIMEVIGTYPKDMSAEEKKEVGYGQNIWKRTKEKIRAAKPTVPIIFYTYSDTAPMDTNTHFLRKPEPLKTIEKKILEVLNNHYSREHANIS